MPGSLERVRRARALRPVRHVYRKARGADRRKARDELDHWLTRLEVEGGELGNSHYEPFYTRTFGLDHTFYEGKRIMDIGCGPRGSLDWAHMTAERVGLDPLVEDYRRELGIDEHPMSYVAAPAEAMPFEDGHFDVVTTFNSLDHVDDIDAVAAEIVRVIAPGGTLLIITELNHDMRWMEPQDFSFEVLDRFAPPMEVVEERRLAKTSEAVYASVDNDQPWDPVTQADEEAVLVARLDKPA